MHSHSQDLVLVLVIEILQAHSSGLYTSLWIAVLLLSVCVTVSPNSTSSANLMRVMVSSHFIVSSQPMTKSNIPVTAVVLFLLLASTAVWAINHYSPSYHPTWILYEWGFLFGCFGFFGCLAFLLFYFFHSSSYLLQYSCIQVRTLYIYSYIKFWSVDRVNLLDKVEVGNIHRSPLVRWPTELL